MASTAAAPVFGLGRLSIEYVFTGGDGDRARWESWRQPADLRRWFRLSSLGVAVAVSEADLGAARRLREALWVLVTSLAGEVEPPRAAVDATNAFAAAPCLVPRYAVERRRLRWDAPTAEQCLSSVARDALELLGDDRLRRRVRECENPACRIVFLDDSRPGRRRWCRPERCGDRLRAKAYRDRRRAADGTR